MEANNLIELSKDELKNIDGGRIPFPRLNTFQFLYDVAKAGWDFGRWVAK